MRFAAWDDRPEFAKWKTDVRVAVEADDFAHNVLWGQYANQGTDFWRRVHGHGVVETATGDDCRVTWEQGRSGAMAQVGKFPTCISLNVDLLDNVPVLFYWATSLKVDHADVRNFIEDTFVGARRRLHGANNFHNVIHDIRRINGVGK